MSKIFLRSIWFGPVFAGMCFFLLACGNGDSDNGRKVGTHPVGGIPPREGIGAISGRVMLAKSVSAPIPRVLEVTKDKEICGASKRDEAFVVNGGGIMHAIVSVVGAEASHPLLFLPPLIDQKKCEFRPRVVFARVGQEITILNNDNLLHNFHAYATANPQQNLAQPKFKKEMKVKFEKPEIIKIACDVHGWMGGIVVVIEHPYYTETNHVGEFRLSSPAGKQTIRVWHEKLGELSQEVEVKSGENTEVVFEMK